MGVTGVGNKAIFAGGYYNRTFLGGETNQADIYDGVTNQWTSATLSEYRHSISTISVDNLAFFAGGRTNGFSYYGSRGSASVDIYNALTGQWATAKLSQGRSNIAVTSTAGKIFFAGGRGDVSSGLYDYYSSALDIYDLTTNQWSSTKIPVGYSFIQAAGAGNKVLVAVASVYILSDFYSYDIPTGQWTNKTVPEARTGSTMIGVGTKVFFAGGSASNGTLSDRVDIYDTATDQWTTATLSQARSSITTIVVGKKIFFAGGSPASSVVDIYDTSTDQWSTAQLSEGRAGIAATSAGSKVFFAGSSTGSSTVDIYETSTDQWSVTQLPQVKKSLSAASAGERALFAENDGLYHVNDPSKIDIYTTNLALPVNLVSFSGIWTENIGTQLTWQTSLEKDNDHFEIQRSADAKSFESIGSIQGKGTTGQPTDYTFTDPTMPVPVSYYRLKQVDLDGSTHFSTIISVSRLNDKQPAQLTTWLTPSTNLLNLRLSTSATISQLTVHDLGGRRLITQTGSQSFTDVSTLPAGIYIASVVTADGQHLRTRFVKP
ncbi:hypothetical protein GCM10028773_39160 [Spirosoma koreense]